MQKMRHHLTILFAFAFILFAIGGYFSLRGPTQSFVFSSGSSLGVYHQIGKQLQQVLQKDGFEVSVQSSEGSVQNVHRIEKGDCHFTLVQNDTAATESLRSIAVLYKEQLHLVVRQTSAIHCLEDLSGKRVSVGSRQGGTHSVTESLLHFALGNKVNSCKLQYMGAQAAIDALHDDKLDAAFLVTGLRAPVLLNALQRGKLSLIAIALKRESTDKEVFDLVGGFRTVYPYVQVDTIPMRAYGETPDRTLPTLSISAVLACHRDVPDSSVNVVASRLFEAKAELASKIPLLANCDERGAGDNLQFPLHTGADNYYRRREPTFLAQHAESMGFLLTVILLFGSGVKGVASWKKKRTKDHIDWYFEKLADIASRVALANSVADLDHLQTEIVDLEEGAGKDLVAEKIRADQSFIVMLQISERVRTEIGKRIASQVTS